MPRVRVIALVWVGWALAFGIGAAPESKARPTFPRKVEFNRDVRPILSENCFACHGPDKSHRKADLRLDLREEALKKEAFVPGQPDESELLYRVLSDDPEEIMPPPDAHKILTAAQKDILKRWIESGAEYQPHWAYVNPTRPEVPAVQHRDWLQGPIDAFILSNLEAKGINVSPKADRRALLRRLSLDLIGLPPTPEEVEAFVNDQDPKAYERQVDRLLESPHYGERMAVPWLDLVRFSDTVGYHGDQNQRIFPYRDYVINAFNRNMPFDQFTVEQLAGDLLPNPTKEQLVATGFNRLNMMTREGGAQPGEYLAKYAADRVRTVAITWLGSTMGCAECHDHKFDPFTAKDFYSLAAFFADVKQWGVYSDYKYSPNPDLKGWNNDYPFPPEVEIESPYLVRRAERLRGEIAQVVARSAETRQSTKAVEEFESWCRESLAFLDAAPTGWIVPSTSTDDQSKPVLQADGSFLITGPAQGADDTKAKTKAKARSKAKAKAKTKATAKAKAAPQSGYLFVLKPEPGWVASVRLELLPHARHGGSILQGEAESSQVQLKAWVNSREKNTRTPLVIVYAEADRKEERYSSGAAILGVHGAWKTSAEDRKQPQTADWRFEQPVRLAPGEVLEVEVAGANLGCLRLSTSRFGLDDPRDQQGVETLHAALKDRAKGSAGSAGRETRVETAYLLSTGWDQAALAKVNALRLEVEACRDGKAFSMITQAWEPRPTRVLNRGNWLDETGEIVAPAVPAFLSQPSSSGKGRLDRLDLARWIVAPENPLTPRVFVNRLWKQFFGIGISAVMEDVGAQGEPPVHPELLDWLAVEFRQSGWNVKHLVKLMVMSATYRQDSRIRPEVLERDPENRWLAWNSPRRLEAEFVRDNALAVSGLLNPEVGGPSAFPYQPDGYYANIQFPDRFYRASEDQRQYRRGVYSHWQRTFMHPMLANFDAPSREECTATRTVANTPQQALTLLNDPTFVEAARCLADSVLATKADTDRERLNHLYQKVLARPAREKESASLLAFLETQRALYREKPEDAKKFLKVGLAPAPHSPFDASEIAAWTSVCRVVLNLNETITRY